MRTIGFPPKSRIILLKYLARAADDYCFAPRDSESKRRAKAHAERKTPLSYGNRPGSKLVDNPRWQPGHKYTTDSYRRAIQRACDKAFPAPEGTEGDALSEWRKSHRWFPNQIRHTAITEVRRDQGPDAAQAFGGHAHLSTTEIYALLDLAKVIEVAKRIG